MKFEKKPRKMKKGANMAGPIPMTDRNASMVGRVPSGPLSYNPPSHPTIHHIPLILKEASKEVHTQPQGKRQPTPGNDKEGLENHFGRRKSSLARVDLRIF
ncbi:unnamed protein product [Microthlaspi erraticum]|uniref:Uncharacterized protein n=1 Tax=Microthlaspi erraticum TaxID=1685480 RepID=A0A6D2L3B6_9BRAS|nr:unnamed protein product [Microthlaspi erraticum]